MTAASEKERLIGSRDPVESQRSLPGPRSPSNSQHDAPPTKANRHRVVLAVTACLVLLVGAFLLSSNLSSSFLQEGNAEILHRAAQDDDEDSDNLTTVANKALDTLNADLQVYPEEECKVTVLITRHCNDYGIFAKDDGDTGDKHCSFVGYERTKYFAMKFESHDVDDSEDVHRRWPVPSALYALLPEQSTQNGGINYRQIEMLLPLAKRTGVSIQVVATPEEVAESVFAELQQNRDVCGQIMVVAWKHRFIPDVAAALGCGPDQGCYESYPDEEFDQVWMLRFIYEPPAPEDEVLKLLDEGSSLIQDNYGYLASQKKWQEGLTQKDIDNHERTDRYQHPDIVTGTFALLIFFTVIAVTVNECLVSQFSPLGWTVYGGRTDQDFDPLNSEYHGEIE